MWKERHIVGTEAASFVDANGLGRGSPVSLGGRSVVELAVLDCIANELGAGLEPELPHDVRAVRLGGAHGYVELLRDLLVRMPEREQLEHLPLAVRQGI